MASVSSVTRSIRNVGRVAEIARALVEYGFDDFLMVAGFDDLIFRARRVLKLTKPNEELVRKPQAERIRLMLEQLGPTAIKIGQVLSTRPDLIPKEWADEFRKLQDDVPPIDWEKIKPHIVEQYDKPLEKIFSNIEEEPLAAASMAQVHRATLVTGEKVVIKCLRPGIRKAIRSDMDLLATLAELARDNIQNLGYDPVKVVEEFSQQLNHEMNLTREGRACDRLNRAFEEEENVSFPKVYWRATHGDCLVMEEIKGERLSRVDLSEYTSEDRRQMVEAGVEAVFRQCFELGFFHADPHPGNIMINGRSNLIFLDCGMTGHLEPRAKELLADLIYAVLQNDLDLTVDAAVRISDADPLLARDRAFRNDVWDFIVRFQDASFKELRIGDTLDDFFTKLRRHDLQCPSDLIYMIKAITTIEGVGEQIDPTFDIAGFVKPMMRKFIEQRKGIGAMRRRVIHNLYNFAELAEEMPDHIRTLMQVLQRNGFTINLEHRGIDGIRNTVDSASREVSNALLMASVVLASAVLLLAGSVSHGTWGEWVFSALGLIGFVTAAGMMVIHLIVRRFRR